MNRASSVDARAEITDGFFRCLRNAGVTSESVGKSSFSDLDSGLTET